MDYIEELLTFIGRSPTAFHAVGNIAEMLSARGFRSLNECEDWALEAGRGYYVTRNHECCPYVNTFEPPQKARKMGVSCEFGIAHPHVEHLKTGRFLG